MQKSDPPEVILSSYLSIDCVPKNSGFGKTWLWTLLPQCRPGVSFGRIGDLRETIVESEIQP